MPPDQLPEGNLSRVIHRNIDALVQVRQEFEDRKGLQDRVADRITTFTGSMWFVYLHLVFFGSWIIINLGWTPIKPWDPSFVILAMEASVEAIFLSTFILISQNRMLIMQDRRAELDLQISLLSEHEVTHLVKVVNLMAAKMGIEIEKEAEELQKDVQPEVVWREIESVEDRVSS